ncbi:MAG: hypothetical protein JWN04_2387 [Myxococcaceae bacterium]|nr:hypothetical protein [Myxococcaceae bacterium]
MTGKRELVRQQPVALAMDEAVRAVGRGPARRRVCGSATLRLAWSWGVALKLLVVVSVGLTCVLAAVHQSPRVSPSQLADEVTPLPELVAGCRLQGEQARAHASALEQSAHARWQRVPFELREAPRALLEVGEAVACYAAAGDRAGRLRSAAVRHVYEAEVERRFARARLRLLALSRRSVAHHRAPQQDAQARYEVATLLALLDHAPSRAEPLRRELLQLERSYAGLALAGRPSNEVKR